MLDSRKLGAVDRRQIAKAAICGQTGNLTLDTATERTVLISKILNI